MMILFHITVLLNVALALLILNQTKVFGGTVIVQSGSTYCDGLVCPAGSSCMVRTGVINGNTTSDKRCSNIYGEVVRQETVTVSNGEICITNLTMVQEKVNVEHTCRNLSKAERDSMEQEENNRKIQQEAVQAALEQTHDVIEKAIAKATFFETGWLDKLGSDLGYTNNNATEDRGFLHLDNSWEKQLDSQVQKAEATAELVGKHVEEKLSEMEAKLEAMFG